MTDDFLQKLLSAKNDDKRSWLVTQNLLNSLPENVQRAVFAAAIPHWFNKEILTALLPDIAEEIDSIYGKIQSLPFTEPYQGYGSNIHETTRNFILNNLWENNLNLYKALSRNASEYFSAEFEKNKDKKIRIEQIYHAVISEAENNSNVIWEQGAEWHDEREGYTYSTLNALVLSIQEHIKANRVEGIAVGWTWFWDALIASYHYEYEKSKTLFKRVISTDYGNDTLKVNCISALGDVHNKLSELPEARARYEEALPLYRAIGEKIGEANCIKALGDVHNKLSELPEARARYEEALPLYHAIGEKIGEANCISALGDVHNKLSELPEARARYEEALPLYRAIGEKIGEIYSILSLGEIAAKEKNFDLAIELVESTIELAQKVSLAQIASTYNNLANIYDKKKEYPKAVEFYTKAMDVFTGSQAYMIRNRASMYLKMEDAENAEKDIALAEKIQPVNPFLFLRMGQLSNLKEDYKEAIVWFEKALELIPRFSGAFFGIGMSNLRAGKFKEAKVSYQQGLSITDAVDELEDTIEELEKLQIKQPSLGGVNEILELLKKWRPEKK